MGNDFSSHKTLAIVLFRCALPFLFLFLTILYIYFRLLLCSSISACVFFFCYLFGSFGWLVGSALGFCLIRDSLLFLPTRPSLFWCHISFGFSDAQKLWSMTREYSGRLKLLLHTLYYFWYLFFYCCCFVFCVLRFVFCSFSQFLAERFTRLLFVCGVSSTTEHRYFIVFDWKLFWSGSFHSFAIFAIKNDNAWSFSYGIVEILVSVAKTVENLAPNAVGTGVHRNSLHKNFICSIREHGIFIDSFKVVQFVFMRSNVIIQLII